MTFGLQLPKLSDLSTPEAYWTQVNSVISRLSKWEVRREACLGFFSFHKLSMYADIDPSNWSSGNELDQGSLVDRLICGGSGAGQASFASDYEIDRDETAQQIQLVQDADSSQHSALCDIALQKNLVIEGPPGTGKSQTITNAIAHAIATGKSVLFVSEKLAALEVVYRRLERLGLAPYCLEIHSHQAVPKSILESLKSRLDVTATQPKNIESARRQGEAAKANIRRYLDATSKLVGPAQEALYSLLWRVIELKGRGIKSFRNAQFSVDVDDLAFHRTASSLRQFTQALSELPNAEQSPWWGYFPDRLNPNDVTPVECHLHTLRERARSITGKLERLATVLSTPIEEWRHRVARIDADNFYKLANSIPAIELESLKLLRIPEVYEKTMALRERVIAHAKLYHHLVPVINGEPHTAVATAGGLYSALTNELAHLPLTSVLSQWTSSRTWLTTTKTSITQLLNLMATLSQCGFGRSRTINEISKLRALVGLSQHPVVGNDMPDQCLYFDGARNAVAMGSARATQLLEKKESLEQSFSLELAPDRAKLHALIAVLRKHYRSPIRFVYTQYRAANNTLFQFAQKYKKQTMGTWIVELDRLSSYFLEVDAFLNDERITSPILHYFNGLKTDWTHLTELLNWVRTARNQGLDYEATRRLADARRRLPQACSYGALGRAIQAFTGQWNADSAQFAGINLESVGDCRSTSSTNGYLDSTTHYCPPSSA